MSLAFPANPTVGQAYANWIWSGTAWDPKPFVVPVASGNRVLIASQTVTTAVAAVDFTIGINNTYDVFEVECIDIITPTASAAAFAMRGSINGGAAWRSGANDYSYGYSNAGPVGYSGGGGSAAYLMLSFDTYPSTTYPLNCFAKIFRPWHASVYGAVLWQTGQCYSDGNWYSLIGACQFNFFAINALRSMFNTGNIRGGTINLYGIGK